MHALTPALIVLVSRFTLGEQTTARQLVSLLVSIFGATQLLRADHGKHCTRSIQYWRSVDDPGSGHLTVYSVLVNTSCNVIRPGSHLLRHHNWNHHVGSAGNLGNDSLSCAGDIYSRVLQPGIYRSFASFTAFLFWIAACRQSAPVAPGSFQPDADHHGNPFHLFLHEVGSYHLVGDCSSWWEFIWCVRYNKRPRESGPFGEREELLFNLLGRFIDSLRNNIEN